LPDGNYQSSRHLKFYSTQLSSFFGNELLWGRKSSINNLESHLKYWNDLNNFKEITEYIREEKFTLVASPGKC